MKHTIAILAAAITLALAGCATPDTSGDVNIMLGMSPPTAKAEAEDAKLLDQVARAVDKGGYPGMSPYLARMRAALDRAPADYPLMAKQPNGDIIVRANDSNDGMMLSILAVGMMDKGKGGNVVQGPNVYPMLALMLGSEAVERGAWQDAHAFLDRGIAMQPDNSSLLVEKSAAYLGQENWTAALAIADKALADDSLFLTLTLKREPFLRKRGYALVELGRLKEGREAYAEALKLDENDKISRNEIAYIDGLLAGAAPTPGAPLISPASRPN